MRYSLINILLVIALIFVKAIEISAQELNCSVEINHDQVQGTNTSVFETLQEAVAEYMNNTRFTNAQFSPVEKIECRMFFTIKEYTDDTMTGDLQVQATRPVYNSGYTTTLLNFRDTKIDFTYQEHERLVFSDNNWESNLTSILNFYAYLILALDFDSYSPSGGQPYYDKMESIVQLAQSSGDSGWKTFENNRNRAAVLAAYTNGGTSALRNILYEYHRKGLDEMSVSPDKGRATITKTLLENLPKVADSDPMSIGLSMLRDSKIDELVNVYSKGTQDERESIYKLLHDLYPTEENRLMDIKNPPRRN